MSQMIQCTNCGTLYQGQHFGPVICPECRTQEVDATTRLRRTVSRNVDRLMREQHVYNAALAKKTGLSCNTIYNARSGHRLPTFENAVRITSALGVSLDELTVDIKGVAFPKGGAE